LNSLVREVQTIAVVIWEVWLHF